MKTSQAATFSVLLAHQARLSGRPMRDLFSADSGRFDRFSTRFGDMVLDYSRNRIDEASFAALLDLAVAADVPAKREAMFNGEPINRTEGRSVLHVALRADPGDVYPVAGRNVVPEVQGTLDRVFRFAEAVRSGAAGGLGGSFTDVVNLGIGGSDLGPAMVTRAVSPYRDGPRIHFVSNVDGAHLSDTLAELDPSRTLVIVVSKTFTTVETMTNAASARNWLAGRLGEGPVGKHLAAISTAVDKASVFGIAPDRVFGFWDWVGGRYSVWSAVGLSVALAIGPERFRQFLRGGRAMDQHFRQAPLAQNLPVILGLLGVWHRNVWGYPAYALLPYDQRLERLPAYLQQLDMESNGKGVLLDGTPAPVATGPLVFGEPGTNGQHAFYQFLHQSPDITPVDFLVAANAHERDGVHHDLLLANCLAQSEALMRGRTLEEARIALEGVGLSPSKAAELAPHKVFTGNRPSNTILYKRLDPFTLGMLIALYEHKVFVQGAIWGINSFDQWGVELGKEYATKLLPAVQGQAASPIGDEATRGLLEALSRLRERPGS